MTSRWLRKTNKERFWSKVARPPDTETSPPRGECWKWRGPVKAGYGRFGVDGVTWGVHRLAYTWQVGPIPDGLHIDHLCNEKLCVRPSHLEAVSARTNNVRLGARRRGHALQSNVELDL